MSDNDSTEAVSSPNVVIRDACAIDLPDIVKVHLAAFSPQFTLSAMGPAFLRRYYDQILRFDEGILLVAEIDGRIVGFASGFLNPRRFYATLMRHKWQFVIPAIAAIPGHLYLLWRLWHLVHRVLFPFERLAGATADFCELSSIAVQPDRSCRGVGKLLVSAFVRLSRHHGATTVSLTTDAKDNEAVNAFYKRLGFSMRRCFTPEGGREMNEYLLDMQSPEAAALSPVAETANEEVGGDSAVEHRIKREESRIEAAYGKRPAKDYRYSWFTAGHLFMEQQFERDCLALLKRQRLTDTLDEQRILEVGCGTGLRLRQFIKWGSRPENLHGVDLLANAIDEAKLLAPSTVTLNCADAVQLNYPDNFFDIVVQSTVFTSILDPLMKQQLSQEMLRVLRPDGFILWYDFFMDNPGNPNVRAVKKDEIQTLFPRCRVAVKATTLAPPLSRPLAPLSWMLCSLLAKVPSLCTHYLGVIRKEPEDTKTRR